MIGKVSGIVMFVCSAAIYVLALQSPDDPLLLFVSGNPLVSSLRLILAISLIVISFKTKFRYKETPKIILAFGAPLAILSVFSLFDSTVEYSLYSFIKPLDYVMLLQMGLTYSLIGLTYKTGNRKLYFKKTVNDYLDVQRSKLKKLETRET